MMDAEVALELLEIYLLVVPDLAPELKRIRV